MEELMLFEMLKEVGVFLLTMELDQFLETCFVLEEIMLLETMKEV